MHGLPMRLKQVRFTESINAFLPSQAEISLTQYEGTIARACVSVGDIVKEGQCIAEATPHTVAVHASIPGVVREFKEIPMPSGKKEQSLIIDLYGAFSILGKKRVEQAWQFLPAFDIMQKIEDAGIINTFTHPISLVEQLRTARRENAKALIVRLFDADPSCETDIFVFEQYTQEVLLGAVVAARASDISTIFLIHNCKIWNTDATAFLSEMFPLMKIFVVSMYKKPYPTGTMQSVSTEIAKAFGSKVYTICSQHDVYLDAVTALSLYEALVYGIPLLERFVQVSGDAIVKSCILKVRIGTRIGDIIEECGGFSSPPHKIVMNGLLLGQSVYDLHTPITKYTKSLCVLSKDTDKPRPSVECVRCGSCSSMCPSLLQPMRIWSVYRKNTITKEQLDKISMCQECALCSFVCPSGIPLFQIMSYLKHVSIHE